MASSLDRASKFKQIATAAKPEAERHANAVFEPGLASSPLDVQPTQSPVSVEERPRQLAESVKKYPQVTISASPSDKQRVLRLQAKLLALTGRSVSKSDIYAAALRVFEGLDDQAVLKNLGN